MHPDAVCPDLEAKLGFFSYVFYHLKNMSACTAMYTGCMWCMFQVSVDLPNRIIFRL